MVCKRSFLKGKKEAKETFAWSPRTMIVNLEAFKMKSPLQISYPLCQQLLAGLLLKMSASLDLYV